MKKTRKAMSLVLGGLLLAASLAGCGKEDAGDSRDSQNAQSSQGSGQESGSSQEESRDSGQKTEDLVELTWIIQSGPPEGVDAWVEKANEYLAEQIGVKLNLEFYKKEQISTIRQSNSGFDIVFTEGNVFYEEQKIGVYADIAPYLETVGKEMHDALPAALWDAVTIDGGIYAVPVYKDISQSFFFFWDTDVCKTYEVDYAQFDSLQSPGLTEALLKIKEGTGEPSVPMNWDAPGVVETKYDNMNLCKVLGIAYGDKEGKVVSVFEQEDVLADLRVLREWYEKGIINSDANVTDTVPDYKVFQSIQAWPSYADSLAQLMGCNVGCTQWGDTVMSNTTITACLNTVSSNCKNPEKAVEFLNFVNTDTKFRDMLKYGTEGQDFQYNEDGTVTRLDTKWTMPNYMVGNFFVNTPEDTEGDQMADIKQQNERAVVSVGVGLTIDRSGFEDELANCNEIYNRYSRDLMTGAADPETVVPQMLEELKSAGLDTIIEQVQAQVDAHLSK